MNRRRSCTAARSLLPLAVVAAAGCAAPPAVSVAAPDGAESCLVHDWRDFGERAGASGQQAGIVEMHIASCAPDDPGRARAAFVAGHAEGLSRYCTVRVHYERGRAGDDAMRSCADADPALEAAFAAGREVHAARAGLGRQERRLAHIEQYARVGTLQPRDRERFGDPPEVEREAAAAARRKAAALDRRYSERFGAEPLPPP